MAGFSGMRGPTGNFSGQMLGNKVPEGYSLGRLKNFTPEQMNLFQSLFSQVSPQSFTGRLASGDQDLYNQIEAPALQQFSGLQGNLASRFSGMGLGARRSSGFQNTANQAASDFAQQLQSQRLSLQQNAIKELLGMSQGLLSQRPYEQTLAQKPQGFLDSLGGGLGQGIGALGSLFFS